MMDSAFVLTDTVDAAAQASVRKTLLTFEGLPTNTNGTIAVPAGYGRLQWDNIRTVKPSDVEPTYGVSGYSTGRISGDQVAYVGAYTGGYSTGAIASGSAANFSLVSAYLTAAWRDGETVTITGYDDGVERYVRTVVLNDDAATFVRLNMTGVDRVVFYGSGGTSSRPQDYGASIVIDDLRVATGPGSISGTVYDDRNGNGVRNAHDEGFANRLVYIDENHNGQLDPGERRTRTADDGSYGFANLAFGEYDVSFVPGGARTATTQEIVHHRYTFFPAQDGFYPGQSTLVTPLNSEGQIDRDEGIYVMALTTPLELWGNTYSKLYISVNGLIEFDGKSEENFKNTALPNNALGPLIAPFWTDLTFQYGGDLLVAQDATTHQVVVTWSNVHYYGQPGGVPITFQVVISPNGKIDFHYGQTGAVPSSDTNGITIGVQGDAVDGARTYTTGTTVPAANSEIAFAPYVERTYGVEHVIVDAGSAVTGVDFGATRASPAAFGEAHAADIGMMAHPAAFLAHAGVEHAMLV